MKNHLISIILGCIVLLCALAGCQSDESPEASVSVPPTNPTTNIPVESNTVQSDSVKSDYPKSVEEGILSRQDIQRIYYGPTETLLISTPDTLYWYDVSQNKILSQRPTDNWLKVAFYPVGNTLCAVVTVAVGESTGGFASSTDAETMCIFFDEKLQEIETVNLCNLGDNRDFIRCAAVSGNGGKIAYATQDKLYCYDRGSDTLDLVLDFSRENMENNYGLSSISSVSFASSADRILFCGNSFSLPLAEGQHSYMTYGGIYLDGAGLQNLPFQDFEADSLVSSTGGYMIFEESMKSASGKVVVIDAEDMSQQVYSLGSVKEGTSGLFCSQGGRYYATEEVGTNSLTLRVYERATGQLACTHTFEDASAEYFYRTPSVYIIDNQKLCIVKLGGFNEISSKVVIFAL